MNAVTNIERADAMTASMQWSSRPNDQRFTSLLDLQGHFQAVRDTSWGGVATSRDLVAVPDNDNQMKGIQIFGKGKNDKLFEQPHGPTHFAFQQLASLVKAPASYLRTLPAPLVADLLNWGFRHGRDVEELGLLLTNSPLAGGASLRAATGPNYGRIWNVELANELVQRFGDGITGDWKVPGEFGKAVDITKANTTIYGSDRDMFVFLADEKNRIEVLGRRNGESGGMARGFFVWNSEVGGSSIGGAFFLFDYVCCNRIVWGSEQFNEVRIRHTSGAPDRWLEEVTPILAEYSESSAKPVLAAIEAAKEKKIDNALDFLKTQRFSNGMMADILKQHEEEEGRPVETVWDAVTGITAYARNKPYQDERVALERIAGSLMRKAA